MEATEELCCGGFAENMDWEEAGRSCWRDVARGVAGFWDGSQATGSASSSLGGLGVRGPVAAEIESPPRDRAICASVIDSASSPIAARRCSAASTDVTLPSVSRALLAVMKCTLQRVGIDIDSASPKYRYM